MADAAGGEIGWARANDRERLEQHPAIRLPGGPSCISRPTRTMS